MKNYEAEINILGLLSSDFFLLLSSPCCFQLRDVLLQLQERVPRCPVLHPHLQRGLPIPGGPEVENMLKSAVTSELWIVHAF